jgi:hypothetical protein
MTASPIRLDVIKRPGMMTSSLSVHFMNFYRHGEPACWRGHPENIDWITTSASPPRDDGG